MANDSCPLPSDGRFVDVDATPHRWSIDRGLRGSTAYRCLALIAFMATVVPLSIGLVDLAIGLTPIRGWEVLLRAGLALAATAALFPALVRDRWHRRLFERRPLILAALDHAVLCYAQSRHSAHQDPAGGGFGSREAFDEAARARAGLYDLAAQAHSMMRSTASAARRDPSIDVALAEGLRAMVDGSLSTPDIVASLPRKRHANAS